ncbi:SgcJ/EcaC family oxidoreductase [Streptomyces noboritoensis]|uniref:SgcJ/EcaC family oxidoreductase n=1 Tax=Streptomyces noboritoensis TaxID=67337 RepID=A0ABV6T9I0_9ACTN
MKPLVAGVAVPEEDVSAVVRLVAQVEYAQQNGLPDAFTELFGQEAVWTVPHGDPLTGLAAISAFARRSLPATVHRPLTVTCEAESIVFVRPDLAVVKIRQRPITRDGRRLGEVLRGYDGPGLRSSRCDRPSAAQRRWASVVAAHPDVAPGTPVYVLTKDDTKDDGRWRIALAQSTASIDHDAFEADRTLPTGAHS